MRNEHNGHVGKGNFYEASASSRSCTSSYCRNKQNHFSENSPKLMKRNKCLYHTISYKKVNVF